MSAALNTDPEQVRAYPYALGVPNIEDPERMEYLHYDSKRAAAFMAHLMTDDTMPRVKRYVANLDTLEWHEVTYFLLEQGPTTPVTTWAEHGDETDMDS